MPPTRASAVPFSPMLLASLLAACAARGDRASPRAPPLPHSRASALAEAAVSLERQLDLAIAAGDDGRVCGLAPQVLASRPPDLVLPDGREVDLGGSAGVRAAWIGSLWRTGSHGEAITEARALLDTRVVGDVYAAVGMAPPREREPALRLPGASLPPWSLPLRDGTELSLEAMRGRPLLLALWASWCPPCLEELPQLDALARRHPQLRVVAVSLDEGPGAGAAVDRVVAQLGLGMPVAVAPALGTELGVEALPTTLLAGPGGTVVHRERGYGLDRLARLESAVLSASTASGTPGLAIGQRWGEGTLAVEVWSPSDKATGGGGPRSAPAEHAPAIGSLSGGQVVRRVVSGPFGPEGAERVVVATVDGRVIGLDGAGHPSLVADLGREVDVSVVLQGEGRARLRLTLPGLGAGLVVLGLP